MSKNVIRAIKNRNTAYKLLKHSDVQRNRDKYNNTKREVKKLIRIERRNQEIQTSRDAKCNAKKFFSYVNSRKPIKAALNDIKMQNGNLSTSYYEKAIVLNDYFKSVFAGADNSNTNIRTITRANPRETPLNEIEITENDILRFIDKMNKFKSPGPDNFVPQVIKEVKHAIVSNLQHIFKLSINNCEIPNDWKQANIVPIYKKGNKTLPENYRPISLTSIICKILESIISEKITAYVDTNNLITKNQHGFRRKRSCTTNLLDFYGKVLKDFDTAKGVDLIYLDFQKAFDKVQHDLLVKKLSKIGIQGKILKWVENWLQNRSQRVTINGEYSTWATVGSGVIQGSVLGPNLFVLFANDLDSEIECNIATFADDTKLGYKADNITHTLKLQRDLDRIVAWATKWNMTFNVDKCKVIHVGANNIMYN